jgi:RING finger protein 170
MTETLIEGIGDEVVLGVTSMLCSVFGLALALKLCNSRRTVHPERVPDVQRAREQLRANRGRVNNAVDNERPIDPDRQCPVCLGRLAFAIDTNCGHTFCVQCIVTYWREGRFLSAVSCPVCRQSVTLLLPAFTAEELENIEGRQSAQADIDNYNRRYSGQPRPV